MTTTAKKTTIAKVNAALKAEWPDQDYELWKDRANGGFAFIGGDSHRWLESYVCAYRITDMTVDQWIAEARALRAGKK